MDSLFDDRRYEPLAHRLRPQSLAGVVGQDHVVGKDKLLTKLVEENRPTSLLFWGPPGTGKTTIARILAQGWELEFAELSAVTSGVKHIREIVEQAKRARLQGEGTLLFVDEIHRFNKSQQDAFLPHVEDGTIVLIGATTENPSFELNNALLSRLRVVTLELLPEPAMEQILKRGLSELKRTIDPKAKALLIQKTAGDARAALNALEVADSISTVKRFSQKTIRQALQSTALQYDKQGEYHYNLASALIKSLRGSDVDASLYYLHRMLAGGADPLFIARRLIIFASEDVGIAAPYALTLAVATFQAVERVGLPEAEYNLSHAVVSLAQSPKSRAVTRAMYAAKEAVSKYPQAQVPLHIRNAPTQLMRDKGYQKGYTWQEEFKPKEGFLPKELKNKQFFQD